MGVNNIEGSLQGPLFGDKMSFFMTGRVIDFEGAIYGQRRFMPQNIVYVDSTNTLQLHRDPEGQGDESYVSMHGNTKVYVQNKISYQMTPYVQFSLITILDDVYYREFISIDN